MVIEWRNLSGTRHVFTQGETLCGFVGLEMHADAAACQPCLGIVMELVAKAFPDDEG